MEYVILYEHYIFSTKTLEIKNSSNRIFFWYTEKNPIKHKQNVNYTQIHIIYPFPSIIYFVKSLDFAQCCCQNEYRKK